MDKATIDEVRRAVSESIEKNKDHYRLLEEYDRGEYNNKFVPELHDIGKIWNKTGEKLHKLDSHTFIPKDFKYFKSASWWGQFHQHPHCHPNRYSDINCMELRCWTKELSKRFPQNQLNYNHLTPTKDDLHNLFILILADHLASSISRVTLERYTGTLEKYKVKLGLHSLNDQETYKKLWNKKQVDDEEYLDEQKIICIINETTNHKEFLESYKELLKSTPEDKSIPRNLTTLYTHLELVGKIFRVLSSFEINDDISIKKAEGGKRIKVKQDKGMWQAIYAECKITFPHTFVRLQDINLLARKRELIECIKDKYADNVLFTTSDTIILFLTEDDKIKDILRPLTDEGFDVSVEYVKADLGILKSNLIRKIKRLYEENDKNAVCNLKNRETRLKKIFYSYEEIKEEVKPPICDICQRMEASERIKDNIKEWICDRCWRIREMGEPFKEYGEEWDQEGVDVCWFKFSINHKKLEEWIERAFNEYLQETCYIEYNVNRNLEQNKQNDKDLRESVRTELTNVLMEEFRPLALMIDFNEDYELMLKEFWEEINKNNNDIKQPIKDYNELGVFKYTSDRLKGVIDTYLNVYNKYFPDCKSGTTPINLSLFIESIKYPIREYWRYLDDSENKGFLNIKRHKSLEDAQYTMEEVKKIMDIINNISSSFLYNLLTIYESTNSNIYVEIEIFNNRDRYPQLYNLISHIKGLAVSKIFTLYKLLSSEYDEITRKIGIKRDINSKA